MRIAGGLKEEDYNSDFVRFISRLGIAKDFKWYEEAYINEIVETLNTLVSNPEKEQGTSYFKNKEVIARAKENLTDNIKNVVNSLALHGDAGLLNEIELDTDVALLIGACMSNYSFVVPSISVEGGIKKGVAYCSLRASVRCAVSSYIGYLRSLENDLLLWVNHYIDSHDLRCSDGTPIEVGGWLDFRDTVAHILVGVAVTMTLPNEGYFFTATHSIYEKPALRFVLDKMHDDLGVRVFYNGVDTFDQDRYEELFYEWLNFGSTYQECYTEDALNSLWDDPDVENKILNAGYTKDSYLLVIKGTEAEKNIDQLIIQYPEYGTEL